MENEILLNSPSLGKNVVTVEARNNRQFTPNLELKQTSGPALLPHPKSYNSPCVRRLRAADLDHGPCLIHIRSGGPRPARQSLTAGRFLYRRRMNQEFSDFVVLVNMEITDLNENDDIDRLGHV